jgi:hypothetical protein
MGKYSFGSTITASGRNISAEYRLLEIQWLSQIWAKSKPLADHLDVKIEYSLDMSL